MNYFTGCSTVEEIKKRYKKLAFEYHPDVSSHPNATRIMQDINAQYHAALKGQHQTTSRDSEGEEHTYYYNADHEQAIIDKIKEILAIKLPPYVDLWLVGKWIWIDGTRKDDAEARRDLKAAGFMWHSKRLMWYWKPTAGKTRYAKKASFDDLAEKYGRQAAKDAV